MKKVITIALVLLGLAAAGTAEAQVVGANTQRESLIKPKKEVPEYRPTGGFIQIDLGLPTGLSVGTQLSSNIMVGGGIGFFGCPLEKDWDRYGGFLPLYGEVRFSTPKYNFALFADFKVGADLATNYASDFFEDNKFMRYPFGAMQLGVMWRDFSFGVGPIFFFDERRGWEYYKSGLRVDLNFSISYRITFDAIKRVLL